MDKTKMKTMLKKIIEAWDFSRGMFHWEENIFSYTLQLQACSEDNLAIIYDIIENHKDWWDERKVIKGKNTNELYFVFAFRIPTVII